MTYASNKGLIMSAVQSLVQGLAPTTLANNEVVPRESFLQNDSDLFRGVSIIDMGEEYSEGTVGTQDVGYLVGLIFVRFRQRDATMADDTLQLWYETVRRNVVDARLSVNLTVGSPKQHVMILRPDRNLTDPKKWPNHFIRQMVISVWHRENNP